MSAYPHPRAMTPAELHSMVERAYNAVFEGVQEPELPQLIQRIDACVVWNMQKLVEQGHATAEQIGAGVRGQRENKRRFGSLKHDAKDLTDGDFEWMSGFLDGSSSWFSHSFAELAARGEPLFFTILWTEMLRKAMDYNAYYQ